MEDRIRFGQFEAVLSSGELLQNGKPVDIQQKPFLILAALLSRPGQLIRRSELQEQLWPTTHVDVEHGLNAAIRKLREALGETAREPRFIETLPRRGYRWIGTKPLAAGRAAIGNPGFRILAILPFQDLAGAEPAHFSDGLIEELTMILGEIEPSSLSVLGRHSIQRYLAEGGTPHQVGEDFGADFFLEGSRTPRQSGCHINARLVEAVSRRVVWSRRFETRNWPGDVADEIAREVARFLIGDPRPRQGMPADFQVPPPVYDLYVRGLRQAALRTPDGLRSAVESLEQAVSLKPDYAAGHALLADLHNLQVDYGLLHPTPGFRTAGEYARRALDLSDRQPLAWSALAFVLHRHEWRWREAEDAYLKAIRLNPSAVTSLHRYAEFLSQAGRDREALEFIGQARRLDPLSPILHTIEGWLYYHARQWEQAISRCHWALEIDAGFAVALQLKARSLLQLGQLEQALEESLRARELSPENPFIVCGLGIVHGSLGDASGLAEVESVLRHLARKRYVSPYLLAKLKVASRDWDSAFELLSEASTNGCGWMSDLAVDPELDALRPDPRFNVLLRGVGLPGGSGGDPPMGGLP